MTLLEAPPQTNAETAKPVTPDELLRMPDNSTLELVDGHIVEKNVSVESSEVELHAAARLKGYASTVETRVFPASLGYKCFPEAPDKIRKPDATVVRGERLRELGDSDPGHMPIVPDLAVEVVSRHDTVYEVTDKVQEYLSAGFPLVWVMNPESRTIEVHAAGKKPVLLSAGDEVTAEAALPGFRCKVAELFG